MTLRKYLVLLAVVVFGSLGDTFLARGMKDVGAIDIHHVAHVFSALGNSWVVFGIICLLGFMSSYMTALSFADLTYVLPATAIGYVFMALLSRFWLHEHVSMQRWIGIVLITAGVGLVAGGPSRTEHPSEAGSRADTVAVWRNEASHARAVMAELARAHAPMEAAAPLEPAVLDEEQRTRLEILLAELLQLKNRLRAARAALN